MNQSNFRVWAFWWGKVISKSMLEQIWALYEHYLRRTEILVSLSVFASPVASFLEKLQGMSTAKLLIVHSNFPGCIHMIFFFKFQEPVTRAVENLWQSPQHQTRIVSCSLKVQKIPSFGQLKNGRWVLFHWQVVQVVTVYHSTLLIYDFQHWFAITL